MRLIQLLPAAGLILMGAMPFTPKNNLPNNDSPTCNAVMWTENNFVFKGESLQLQFATPHGSRLGIIDPSGNFFYVVFPSENATGDLKPLMDSKKFLKTTALKINTKTLKADPYTYGVLKNKPVFTQSGTYSFVLGDNLHAHDEQTLTILKVEYRHLPRPASSSADIVMN